jgi:hypothetical protein
MDEGSERLWDPGKGGSVEVAAERAWQNAREAGAEAGIYELTLFIEAENPIRTYLATITPAGG